MLFAVVLVRLVTEDEEEESPALLFILKRVGRLIVCLTIISTGTPLSVEALPST